MAQVGVPGNVEVWVAFCTLFVLASLVEYVFVHVLLCTIPAQLRRVCCKSTATRPATRPASVASCHFHCASDVGVFSVRTFAIILMFSLHRMHSMQTIATDCPVAWTSFSQFFCLCLSVNQGV